jgi:hypothetical protein
VHDLDAGEVKGRRQLTRAIAGLAAFIGLCVTGGCSLEPGFTSIQGEEVMACYAEPTFSRLRVTVDGSSAFVKDGDNIIELAFVGSVWPTFEDRYEGRGYVLTFDPEAFFYRPDGTRLGPCQ